MSQLRKLLVLGAGGHGKAVAEAALLSGEWQQVVFLDDRWPEINLVCGMPVVGDLSHLAEKAGATDGAIAAVGNNGLRRAWQEKITASGISLVSVVHPRACVSASASIGPGSAIMSLAVVGAEARLGQGVIINAGAVADHDVTLGDYAHLGVGVCLAGGVAVGAAAWLQAGCSAGYGVVIEPGLVIEPGKALIAKD
ncbi:acetyltransferase [Pseudomonas sp. EggHat1]|uniref:PglD-related sugar-binding protein n=1 Tax=Pseudomonas sp. EggHat1 TaxID=2761624 RepID=UPI00186657C4|nr:acetyltransferase [Pseudomonas sp. EggHat1]